MGCTLGTSGGPTCRGGPPLIEWQRNEMQQPSPPLPRTLPPGFRWERLPRSRFDASHPPTANWCPTPSPHRNQVGKKPTDLSCLASNLTSLPITLSRPRCPPPPHHTCSGTPAYPQSKKHANPTGTQTDTHKHAPNRGTYTQAGNGGRTCQGPKLAPHH
jgi:hypothetical protein